MQSIKNLRFYQKIQLYVASVAIAISLCLCGMFLYFNYSDAIDKYTKNLEAKANVITEYVLYNEEFINNTAFSDQKFSWQIPRFEFIAQDPTLNQVIIFSHKNQDLTKFYAKDLTEFGKKMITSPEGSYISNDDFYLIKSINMDDQYLGKVILHASLSSLNQQFWEQALELLLIALGCILGFIILALSLIKKIAKPIDSISETIDKITSTKDYSLRISKHNSNDLSGLTHSFNIMLNAIEEQYNIINVSEKRFNLALWGSNEVIFDWDLAHDNWYFDESFESILNFEPQDVPFNKVTFFKLIHLEDQIVFNDMLNRNINGDSSFLQIEFRIKKHTEDWRWILVRSKVIDRTSRGKALRMAGTIKDISDRKSFEKSLILYNKVFNSTEEGVVVTTPKLQIIEANPAFSYITGFRHDEILKQDLNKIITFAKLAKNKDQRQTILEKLQEHGSWQGQLTGLKRNGDSYQMRLTLNAIYDDKKNILHYVGLLADMTQYNKAKNDIQFLTYNDPLTNLPNQTAFFQKLEKIVSIAKENKQDFALLAIGLDNFKIINDSLGHYIGDLLLKEVAKRLQDMLGSNHYLAKLNGDEFGIILTDNFVNTNIEEFTNRVFNILHDNFKIENQDIFLNASIGASIYPIDANTARDLLKHADTAMYHAKQVSGNAFIQYEQKMNNQVQLRHKMQTQLRNALENNEFLLHYQPKYALFDNKIVGVEALIRWQNPELGWVNPEEFISLAEQTGMIIAIGDWLLKEALTAAKNWCDQGFDDIKVAVNLSFVQLKSEDLVEEIAQVIQDTGISPKQLDLELTESMLIDNQEHCILMLKILKAMGITISIDDFGTGYSSLSYLQKMPIDALKIDRSFIANIGSDDESILEAIIAMAKGLKLKIIAEGVENQAQLDFLASRSIDEIQGFYFSKPLPEEELLELFAKNKLELESKSA